MGRFPELFIIFIISFVIIELSPSLWFARGFSVYNIAAFSIFILVGITVIVYSFKRFKIS